MLEPTETVDRPIYSVRLGKVGAAKKSVLAEDHDQIHANHKKDRDTRETKEEQIEAALPRRFARAGERSLLP